MAGACCSTPDRASDQRMIPEATNPTEGTTETFSDDCGCTALMPCFRHYRRERGIPAVRRVPEEAV